MIISTDFDGTLSLHAYDQYEQPCEDLCWPLVGLIVLHHALYNESLYINTARTVFQSSDNLYEAAVDCGIDNFDFASLHLAVDYLRSLGMEVRVVMQNSEALDKGTMGAFYDLSFSPVERAYVDDIKQGKLSQDTNDLWNALHLKEELVQGNYINKNAQLQYIQRQDPGTRVLHIDDVKEHTEAASTLDNVESVHFDLADLTETLVIIANKIELYQHQEVFTRQYAYEQYWLIQQFLEATNFHGVSEQVQRRFGHFNTVKRDPSASDLRRSWSVVTASSSDESDDGNKQDTQCLRPRNSTL